MKNEFLKLPIVSLSWKVTAVGILVFIGTYMVWNNFLSLGGLAFLATLSGITTILFALNRVVLIDDERAVLKCMNRLGNTKLNHVGQVHVDSIKHLFLNKSRITQSITSQRSFHTVRGTGTEYDAYLRLKDDSSFYLGTSENKDAISNEIRRLSRFLNLELRENTE